MRTFIVTAVAAALSVASVASADAAMMKMHAKAKVAMHPMMHTMMCKGQFMYMDMKAHKCADKRDS